MRTPRAASASSTIGPMAATRTRARPSRSRASDPAAAATCHRRSTCDALVNAIASTRAVRQRRDQIRRPRRRRSPTRTRRARPASTWAPAPARKSTSGRFGSSPYSWTPTRRPRRSIARSSSMMPADVGTAAGRSDDEADLLQRARRLRPAGDLARAGQRRDDVGAQADALGGGEQAAQALAGEKDRDRPSRRPPARAARLRPDADRGHP